MGGRPVTIRTLDLGGDKVPGHRKSRARAEPGDGAARDPLLPRATASCSARSCGRCCAPSVHGNLRVMFPLISGLTELREARSELEHCRSELGRAGVPMGGRFPVGIMVETPSARR